MSGKSKVKLENKGFLPYKTSWYPSLDPSINPRHYVYLTSLRMEPSIIENAQYIQASSLVAQSHGAFSIETMTQAYESLYSLYLQERQAEVSFINNKLKLQYDPETISIKELMDSLNKILGFESTYKANIKRIIEPQEKQSQKLEYLYYTTRFTLPGEIDKVLNNQVIPLLKNNIYRLGDDSLYNEIYEILSQTILRVLKEQYASPGMPDENKQYNEFMKLIDGLTAQDQLISDLLKVYGVDSEQIRKKVTSDVSAFDRNEKNLIKAKGGKGIGGFAFESFVEAIGRAVVSGLNGKVLSTGDLGNMKADQIFSFELSVDENKLKQLVEDSDKDEYSRRMKNIQAMEKMFEQLKDAKGDIVFVSDKSYDFTRETFEGFTAESPSLRVAGKVLEKAGTNSELVEHFIFLAANSGAGRINGNNTEDIRRFMTTSIGNFLFDDVVISQELSSEGMSNVNRLHVFNLNNIYVPLSVLLKGLHESLTRLSKDYKQFINVGFSPAELNYSEQKDGLDKKDWDSLYNTSLVKTKFHIHFLKNFSDFIKESLS